MGPGARLLFRRQLEGDELVAAFRDGVYSGHELLGILFQNADVVGTQHYKRELPGPQVLLIFEALVRRNHDCEPLLFGNLQKFAIYKARPTQFGRRLDLVLCEIGPELVRDILIK
jgi:hypothetical protein